MSSETKFNKAAKLPEGIDFDVPIPSTGRGSASTITARLRKLLKCPIGASVFFPATEAKNHTIRQLMQNIGGPGVFLCRTVTEHEVLGARVWKIAERQQ
jgi:hypothetical protein